MIFDSIVSQVTFYGLCTALIAGTLVLLLILKLDVLRRTRRLAQRIDQTEQNVDAKLNAMRKELKDLEAARKQEEPRNQPRETENGLSTGVTFRQRNHVLELHESGMDEKAIAARLALQLSEVKLLLRVHRALSTR